LAVFRGPAVSSAKLVSDVDRIPKPLLRSGRPSMGLLSRWNSSLAHRTFRQAELALKDVNRAMRSVTPPLATFHSLAGAVQT
jgi:hypothetical protein